MHAHAKQWGRQGEPGMRERPPRCTGPRSRTTTVNHRRKCTDPRHQTPKKINPEGPMEISASRRGEGGGGKGGQEKGQRNRRKRARKWAKKKKGQEKGREEGRDKAKTRKKWRQGAAAAGRGSHAQHPGVSPTPLVSKSWEPRSWRKPPHRKLANLLRQGGVARAQA